MAAPALETGGRVSSALATRVAAGAPGALARLERGDGQVWAGAAGYFAKGGRELRAHDAYRAASITKTVTATVCVRLAQEGRLALDESLEAQLSADLLARWPAFDALPATTPRQLLAHTAGLPDYFHDDAFVARLRAEPEKRWEPVELVDAAAAGGVTTSAPGTGFVYSDTGYVVAGLLVEQVARCSLEAVYRELVFDPLGMDTTWLEGHERPRAREIAHHYSGGIDMTTISPTIDWAGGGLVTTARDLARFVRGLWSQAIIGVHGLAELTRWTPGASFPSGHAVRYDRYGLGLGAIVVDGVALVGHTGYIGGFAFYAPEYDAVLVGTHNAAEVDRWPLVAALCLELRSA